MINLPSGYLTKLLNMAMCSWFTYKKGWFSIIVLNYQKVSEGTRPLPKSLPAIAWNMIPVVGETIHLGDFVT